MRLYTISRAANFACGSRDNTAYLMRLRGPCSQKTISRAVNFASGSRDNTAYPMRLRGPCSQTNYIRDSCAEPDSFTKRGRFIRLGPSILLVCTISRCLQCSTEDSSLDRINKLKKNNIN